MAKPAKDSKGDYLTPRPSDPRQHHPTFKEKTAPQAHQYSSIVEHQKDLSEIMFYFVELQGGHLKIRRQTDASDLHLTWTWSLGEPSGQYVYVRIEFWRLAFGLAMLKSKIEDVEAGVRRATPDKLGGGR